MIDLLFQQDAADDLCDAVNRVTEELKKEGFGILADIDVKEAVKKKPSFDFCMTV